MTYYIIKNFIFPKINLLLLLHCYYLKKLDRTIPIGEKEVKTEGILCTKVNICTLHQVTLSFTFAHPKSASYI